MNKDNSICVSIVIPSYNQGIYLEETIQSVIEQTYNNIEMLIIDGGSKDNSVDVIKKYEKQISYWVSEPDKGQCDAINKGMRKAKGELICWVNSDDILYPDFVAQRVRQFEEFPNVGMIYGDIDQGKNLSSPRPCNGRPTDITKMIRHAECPIPQQSAMWRKSVVEKIGYLDVQWNVVLDREYFTRIAANFPIKYISGSVGFFRNHENSKSIMQRLKWAEELPRYYEMVFNNNIYSLPPDVLRYKQECLLKIYLKCAGMLKKAGNKQQAEVFFQKAKKMGIIKYLISRYF